MNVGLKIKYKFKKAMSIIFSVHSDHKRAEMFKTEGSCGRCPILESVCF